MIDTKQERDELHRAIWAIADELRGTVGKTEISKVYDPACGSGSLLLKAEKVPGKDAVRNGFYGREINITTYNLCRINMFLYDVGFDKFIDCIIQLPSNLFFGTSIATCIMVLKKGKTDNEPLFIEAHFPHLASYEEIESNEYNLSVSSYAEAEDTREKIDIVKFNAEIEKNVAREQVFRDEITKIIAEIEVGI